MSLPSYHLMSKRKPLRLAGFCNLNKTALVKNQTTKIVMTINLPRCWWCSFVCLFVSLFFLATVSQMHSNLSGATPNNKLQKVKRFHQFELQSW